MNTNNAITKDNQTIYLLSIDGGGVRGKIIATFLELLERDLKITSNLNIHNLFNGFAGTSTGALISLGLSSNLYNASEIAAFYDTKALNQIFRRNLLSYLPISLVAKYNGIDKRNFLTQVFKNKNLSDLTKLTVITSYDCNNNQAMIFKNTPSYTNSYNPSLAEIADASSAAPGYFPSVVSANKQHNLIDGGIVANDPSMCLLSEALSLNYHVSNIKLLSLGTGYLLNYHQSSEIKNWSDIRWLKNGVIDDLMLGDTSMTNYQCRMVLGDSYMRINEAVATKNAALDNINNDNVQELYNIGCKWYDKYKEQIINFLTNN